MPPAARQWRYREQDSKISAYGPYSLDGEDGLILLERIFERDAKREQWEDGKRVLVSTGPSEMIQFELGKSKQCKYRRGG